MGGSRMFLRRCAPLRNDVTDRSGKQILKANMKKKASSQAGGGVRTPCTLPLDKPLDLHVSYIQMNPVFKNNFLTNI